MRRLLESVAPSGQRLVVHFHGGLVDREHGLATAARLAPIYEQAGGRPLFVLWQSGLLETITSSLKQIAEENIFRRLLARVIQFTLGKASERGGARTVGFNVPELRDVYREISGGFVDEPYSQYKDATFLDLSETQERQVNNELLLDGVLRTEMEKIVRGLPASREKGDRRAAEVGEATTTLMSPEVLHDLVADATTHNQRSVVVSAKLAKASLVTLKRVLDRLRARRDHGVYCTAVEEVLREFYLASVGASLWRRMKRDATDAFGAEQHLWGGAALIAELAAHDSGHTPLLVGHSAGSLYVCNLLAHADQELASGRQFDAVLLAPACDFDVMDRTLVNHCGRIGQLRIFAMSDERERSDHVIPGVYPRSLLYFVSGVLEAQADWPLLGMQRFFTADPPFSTDVFPSIGRVRDGLASWPDSCVWSIATAGPGTSSQAVRHGDFDDDPVTLASVAHLVRGG
jgi:hypothetical protein